MDENKEVKNEVKDGAELKEDTSQENLVESEAKFDQDGNEVIGEPENKEVPSEDGRGNGEEPQPKPSEKKYKYKTQDEAERAYTEAERKMHEATTRASSLERELSQYKKPLEQPVATADDKIAEITKAAIKEIRALSAKFDSQGKETAESIDERETQSAIVWAKANRKIAKLEYEEAHNAEKSEQDIANRLYKKATSNGLSGNNELDLVGMEYGRSDPSMSAEDRISAAVEAAKNRISQLRDGFVKRQQLDKDEKNNLRVLGGGSRSRSTDGGKTKEESKPSNMSDALADINEKRKVKKDDLLAH